MQTLIKNQKVTEGATKPYIGEIAIFSASQASRQKVNDYAKALDSVNSGLDAVFASNSGEEGKNADGEIRSLLSALIPKILIGVVAHLGKHYWTSADSRKAARGEDYYIVILLPLLLYCISHQSVAFSKLCYSERCF